MNKVANALIAGCVAIAIGCVAGCADHETESTSTTEYQTTRVEPPVTTTYETTTTQPVVAVSPVVVASPVVTAPIVTEPANATTTSTTTQSTTALVGCWLFPCRPRWR